MPSPSEKLAQSLEFLHTLQAQGKIAIRSAELPRIHRERLCKNGFLQEVMRGWYIPTRPDETAGENTAWFASFWAFCAAYLKERFQSDWCLSPEQSLSLHAGNRTVPRQLVIRASEGRNNITSLPYDTSLLDVRGIVPEAADIEEREGLRLFSAPAGLLAASPTYFRQNPTDARVALASIRDASDVLDRLLEGGHSAVAGRLAGAFRNIGRERIADNIVKAMKAADYDIRENDPFEAPAPTLFTGRERSPYVNRIRLMWQAMREPILERFPKAPGLPKKKDAYLARVEETYVTDAYHSLSMEGYRVSRELIERVHLGSGIPTATHRIRASITRWRLGATGKLTKRCGIACDASWTVRMSALSWMKTTAPGIGSYSLRASPLACSSLPTLQATVRIRFSFAARCMSRQAGKPCVT